MTQTLQGAIQDIDHLRRDLAAREAMLADRERAISAAQALLEQRLADLEASEARLAALISTSDQAAEGDLDRLTRVYETMPPAEVAAIFAQMQPSFAAGFLTRMSPAASANLMAAMTPQQAYAVSVVIATRNSSAPRLDPGAAPRPETEN
jgi:flagellar motility protein MotE (MotC chaperone)